MRSILALCLALTGCLHNGLTTQRLNEQDQYRRAMNSWIGKDRGAIIMRWGPPTQVVSDGKDGEILIWTEYRQHAGYSHTTVNQGNRFMGPTADTYYRPPTTTESSRMMYVDAEGKIYYWRTR